MERFITMLLAWIMSGNVSAVNVQDTWWIQEQYVIEDYFRRVDEQAPLVYRSGRILWQTFDWIEWGRLTNRTDCSGMLVWHMVELWLVESRYIKWMDWLDSDTLVTLWKSKRKKDVVRWDRVYMRFPSGQKHIAIACDDEGKNIYDFYLQPTAECRPQPPVVELKYATNWAVELLKKREIVLSWTQEVLDYFQKIKDETSQNLSGELLTDDQIFSGNNEFPTSPTIVDVVMDVIRGAFSTRV